MVINLQLLPPFLLRMYGVLDTIFQTEVVRLQLPNTGQNGSVLFAVAAVATNDVWAVGSNYDFSYNTTTLIEHWDGTSWNVVSSPASGSLRGVTVISANDIWAVGLYHNQGSDQTVIEHWNGTNWSSVPSPGQGGFRSVTAVSPTNVWAVGSNGSNGTLIAHWDGTSWSVVSSPNGPLKYNSLTGVVAISPNNIWAVGYDDDLTTIYRVVSQALIEHWDGTSWSIVASQSPMNKYLMGVAAVSAKNIWAVGLSGYQTVTEQWNGSQWSIVSSPSPGQYDNVLNGVARIPHTTDVWAVGSYIDNNSSEVTLTELLSC